jgi:hypothetical protein
MRNRRLASLLVVVASLMLAMTVEHSYFQHAQGCVGMIFRATLS